MNSTTNHKCIPADAVLQGLRRTGTWNGVQKTELGLNQQKNGLIRLKLVSSSWYQAAADVRDLEKTHSYIPAGARVYYVGMDDFGAGLYSTVRPS